MILIEFIWKYMNFFQVTMWACEGFARNDSQSLQSCPALATPWTVARQASLSMRFSRQKYWSGLPSPSPRDLPNPGVKHRSPVMQAHSLQTEPPGNGKSLFFPAVTQTSSLRWRNRIFCQFQLCFVFSVLPSFPGPLLICFWVLLIRFEPSSPKDFHHFMPKMICQSAWYQILCICYHLLCSLFLPPPTPFSCQNYINHYDSWIKKKLFWS